MDTHSSGKTESAKYVLTQNKFEIQKRKADEIPAKWPLYFH